MHVFHIRGFSGVVVLLLAFLAAVALFVLLPSSFMMVLWNAVVFEGMKGPEIDIYQGALLWGMVAVLIKLIFKPEIKLQFQQIRPASSKSEKTQPVKMEKTEEPAPQEATTKLDNQQNQG